MNLALLLVAVLSSTPDAGVADAGVKPRGELHRIEPIKPYIPDGGFPDLITPDQAYAANYRTKESATFTVSAWFKASSLQPYKKIITKLASNEYKGQESSSVWSLHQDGKGGWGLTVSLVDNVVFTCLADDAHKLVLDDEWYALGATFDAKKIYLYKDGQPAGECEGPKAEVGFGVKYADHGPLLIPRRSDFFDGHVLVFTHKDAAWHLRLFQAQKNSD